jgi:hypothetical protein
VNDITNIFGSLITWGLGHIESPHLTSYQIIFLFFGLITVAYSFVVGFLMPDSPMTTKILNEEERMVAIERLRANQMGKENDDWKWEDCKEAFMDLKTYL